MIVLVAIELVEYTRSPLLVSINLLYMSHLINVGCVFNVTPAFQAVRQLVDGSFWELVVVSSSLTSLINK